MSVLLDTHTLLWWLTANRKLSERAKAAVEDPAVTRYVSAASAFEITNKFRIGKLDIARPVVENFESVLAEGHFHKLDITTSHAFLAGQMAGVHKDPFDRMLAAQCRLENLSLVTIDPAFSEFGINIIW